MERRSRRRRLASMTAGYRDCVTAAIARLKQWFPMNFRCRPMHWPRRRGGRAELHQSGRRSSSAGYMKVEGSTSSWQHSSQFPTLCLHSEFITSDNCQQLIVRKAAQRNGEHTSLTVMAMLLSTVHFDPTGCLSTAKSCQVQFRHCSVTPSPTHSLRESAAVAHVDRTFHASLATADSTSR